MTTSTTPKVTPSQSAFLKLVSRASVTTKLNSLFVSKLKQLYGTSDNRYKKITWAVMAMPWVTFQGKNTSSLYLIATDRVVQKGVLGRDIEDLESEFQMPSLTTFNATLKEANWKEVVVEGFALFSGQTMEGNFEYGAISCCFSPTPNQTNWGDVVHQPNYSFFKDSQSDSFVKNVVSKMQERMWSPGINLSESIISTNGHLRFK